MAEGRRRDCDCSMLDMSMGSSARSVGVRDRWKGDGSFPVEYPGLAGGVKLKRSGGKSTTSDMGCEMTPKRDMSSNGEPPRMLSVSKVSVGGDPKLEPEESVDEEA